MLRVGVVTCFYSAVVIFRWKGMLICVWCSGSYFYIMLFCILCVFRVVSFSVRLLLIRSFVIRIRVVVSVMFFIGRGELRCVVRVRVFCMNCCICVWMWSSGVFGGPSFLIIIIVRICSGNILV